MARRLLALEFVERAIQRILRGGLVTTQLTQGIGSPHIFDEGLANGGQHFFALFADLLGPLLVVGVLGLIQNCRLLRQVPVNWGAREAGGPVLFPLFEDTQVMEGVNPVLHVIEPSQRARRPSGRPVRFPGHPGAAIVAAFGPGVAPVPRDPPRAASLF